MTTIRKATLPKDDRGNDPNDHREDPHYLDKLQPISSMLSRFTLNGQAGEMKLRMLDDKFVMGTIALLGQSTVIYARPNAGKTLLVIWMIIHNIQLGEMRGEDVFYINADDNHKGLTHKLELAEQHGFMMLAPGYNEFRADMLAGVLAELMETGEARGKVLILDTVKKFADLMRKDKASIFGNAVRQFVSHGGTVIMLAHVNKHADADGKVIFAGTSDLVDDADCAFTLEVLTDDKATGTRSVKFENFKSRGDVAQEAVYEYNAGEGVTYFERLASVRAVNDQEREELELRRRLDITLDRNREAVEAIKEAIKAGFTQKTPLVKEACSRSGLTRRKVIRALSDHTGNDTSKHQFWHVNVEDKNRHVYQLNWGVN
ncbi:AAA family ATPase [Marinimicrobium sp. ABcell2]|uniref:AAA family ATPase n=1 Tax=Marinimicrobium sp. ABcell2 TaxID=3069751 RepID=UPI0027B69BE2|nr:AAA family ATPase [Marinimicrobium sp. ABcell2]MDQ2077628.1 AAA family ATPase [Marinimicrobium sp. ABcell2]